MTAPADRPLSLARLRALPVGARIRDRRGEVWTRQAPFPDGKPGWWRHERFGTASGADIHAWYRPLHLVDAPAPEAAP